MERSSWESEGPWLVWWTTGDVVYHHGLDSAEQTSSTGFPEPDLSLPN